MIGLFLRQRDRALKQASERDFTIINESMINSFLNGIRPTSHGQHVFESHDPGSGKPDEAERRYMWPFRHWLADRPD